MTAMADRKHARRDDDASADTVVVLALAINQRWAAGAAERARGYDQRHRRAARGARLRRRRDALLRRLARLGERTARTLAELLRVMARLRRRP